MERRGIFTAERPCPECRGASFLIKDPCPACRGEGRVGGRPELELRIPAGVEAGMRLRLAGKGEAAPAGGKAGDLYVSVEVRPHEHFERRAEHLAMRLPVFFHRAALGGEVRIRGIDGRQLSLHVPPGSQSGARLRLAGEGMPHLGGPDGRRGDL